MIPRTAIAQIAKEIGRELNSGAQPSEEALAIGPILAEAGATPEIVGRLFAEAQRNRRNDRMIHAYAFMLEGALGTLRVQASGGDVRADHTIAAVHKEVADNLRTAPLHADGAFVTHAPQRPFTAIRSDARRCTRVAPPSTAPSRISCCEHFGPLARLVGYLPFDVCVFWRCVRSASLG
jgi:hypothetical protein